jgi:ABC-type oligopeptide transport system substrate-binding subunit
MPDKRIIVALVLTTVTLAASAAKAAPYPQTQFVANISDSYPDWRPHKAYNADEAQILSAVYEGLFVYDPMSLDPIPALAESWTVSKDGLEWTFAIRSGAKFSNGDPITAATFRNSWLALLDPSITAPYASLLDPIAGVAAYRTGASRDPASVGIAATDDRTLVLRLSSPAGHLLKILCHHAFAAVHPSQLAAAKGDKPGLAYRPISSGPFTVESAVESAVEGSIVLAKNPLYWDAENVALPSIKLTLGDSADHLTTAFNLGEIQWLAGSTVINRVVGSDSIHVTPMFATEYFFFRTTKGAGADQKLRSALLLAVPWTELRASYLIPAKTLVFPIANYPTLDGIATTDVERAKKALEDAGFKNLSSIGPIVISVPETSSFLPLARILEKAWTDIGLTVEVRAIPYAAYYGTLRTDDYTIGVTSWIGDFADPLTFLEMFRPGSSLNDSGWSDAGFESLITEAAAKKTVQERYELLSKAEKTLLDAGVILPIAHNPALNVIALDGISGWYTNALDIHPFKFISFSAKKSIPGVVMLTR